MIHHELRTGVGVNVDLDEDVDLDATRGRRPQRSGTWMSDANVDLDLRVCASPTVRSAAAVHVQKVEGGVEGHVPLRGGQPQRLGVKDQVDVDDHDDKDCCATDADL